ncbi:hypothetical protein ATCVNTS1_122R [Acanthocystis turfacea Chlorella virus NTS-1]|nr:hypothetical protein ATCVNTS1_122R [Acanthocystis turfacea Chlorella virus NTS-1]
MTECNMDAKFLTSVKRGKFFKPMYDGKPIEIPFEGCKIVRPIYDKYIRLDLTTAIGNRGDLLLVHNYIRQFSKGFSPLKYAAENSSWGDVVCKISNAQWELSGEQITEKYLEINDVVDVVFTIGAFGDFGFYLTIKSISIRGKSC